MGELRGRVGVGVGVGVQALWLSSTHFTPCALLPMPYCGTEKDPGEIVPYWRETNATMATFWYVARRNLSEKGGMAASTAS